MTDGLSAADIMALTKEESGEGHNMWNNPFVYLVWIWAFSAFGGGGFGFGNRGGEALTQAELQRGFDTNTIVNKLDGISNGICDGFYAMNTTNLQGFNGVGNAIANLGYQTQNCCCETNRNIDNVRFDMSRGFCDVINAQAQNTQRILDHLCCQETQALRDQLQTANFQLSQQAQSANLINILRPFPTPAYITCSPYTSACVCPTTAPTA